jgi:hypothetical protein
MNDEAENGSSGMVISENNFVGQTVNSGLILKILIKQTVVNCNAMVLKRPRIKSATIAGDA